MAALRERARSRRAFDLPVRVSAADSRVGVTVRFPLVSARDFNEEARLAEEEDRFDVDVDAIVFPSSRCVKDPRPCNPRAEGAERGMLQQDCSA